MTQEPVIKPSHFNIRQNACLQNFALPQGGTVGLRLGFLKPFDFSSTDSPRRRGRTGPAPGISAWAAGQGAAREAVRCVPGCLASSQHRPGDLLTAGARPLKAPGKLGRATPRIGAQGQRIRRFSWLWRCRDSYVPPSLRLSFVLHSCFHLLLAFISMVAWRRIYRQHKVTVKGYNSKYEGTQTVSFENSTGQ